MVEPSSETPAKKAARVNSLIFQHASRHRFQPTRYDRLVLLLPTHLLQASLCCSRFHSHRDYSSREGRNQSLARLRACGGCRPKRATTARCPLESETKGSPHWASGIFHFSLLPPQPGGET